MGKYPTPRDSGPIIRILSQFLMARKHGNPLRFKESIAAAPANQPKPNIPEGTSHKVAFNYYHTRDGRREVAPPVVIMEGGQFEPTKVLSAGGAPVDSEKPADAVTPATFPANMGKIPGARYNFSQPFYSES